MIGIAVLGFGVVGSGVARLISENAEHIREKTGKEIRIKRILDLREFPDSPFASLLCHDIEEILTDSEIAIVCEVIGGCRAAYDFTRRALLAGKSVVTSNKELVATHGTELLCLAEEMGVHYLFEGSVGGGIPVLHPLSSDLALANDILRIDGILNGTTNYILTRMKEDGMSFADALRGAQERGYAEADPSADIEGKDVCRKICILGALAFGAAVPCDRIPTVGITEVTLSDIENAERLGCSVKLIGSAEKDPQGRMVLCVRPCFVRHENPLAGITDVFNGVLIRGNFVGDVMFYGRGAGSDPTASAVAADAIRIAAGIAEPVHPWRDAPQEKIGDPQSIPSLFCVTVSTENAALAERFFGQPDRLLPSAGKVTLLLREKIDRAELNRRIAAASSAFSVSSVYEVL